jgi:DNA-binding response OmpR family regulator
MRLLLLEDDLILHESLKEYLELEGFEVYSAFNAKELYDVTFDTNFDLYIFDVNLTGESGFEILKTLRDAQDMTPTIYITALQDIVSIAKGFNSGADDYIKKPFEPEELVLRIKSRYIKNSQLTYQDIRYNPLTKEIIQNGKVVVVSRLLSKLFHILMINKNHIVDINFLFDELEQSNSNALRVNLSKLKKRLNLNIKNIRGVGYMLEEV